MPEMMALMRSTKWLKGKMWGRGAHAVLRRSRTILGRLKGRAVSEALKDEWVCFTVGDTDELPAKDGDVGEYEGL